MLPQHAPAPQETRRIGVGIDTSRYGHYAVFLNDDLQPAADELAFAESAAGYALLQQRLQGIVGRYGALAFTVRLDVAGPYADNLLHFLHRLATPYADTANTAEPLALTISCGDPQRNKNYRAALFGSHKSDPVEARAAARFALSERPHSDKRLSLELRILRQVAGRLQAVVRQRTRLINQLHHLLALTFPELALLTKDVAAGWVLELLHRYPSAACLAQATPTDLAAIPYLPEAQVAPLLEQAHTSIASLTGDAVEELVRDQVRQLRDVGARQKRLESLLVSAYEVIGEVDEAIAAQLRSMRRQTELPPLPPKIRQRGRKPHDPRFDVREALYYATGVDLTAIEGIDEIHALTLVSELGSDFTKWPTVKQFCSWLGLCPNWRQTGGKVKSSRTRRGKNRAAQALRLAAWSLLRSKSYLGAYLRRQRGRLGAPKAIVATAHKLARIVYHLVRYGEAYVKRTEEAYAEQVRERVERSLHRRALELGYELKKIEPPAPSPEVVV